jgi:hypothetical protein
MHPDAKIEYDQKNQELMDKLQAAGINAKYVDQADSDYTDSSADVIEIVKNGVPIHVSWDSWGYVFQLMDYGLTGSIENKNKISFIMDERGRGYAEDQLPLEVVFQTILEIVKTDLKTINIPTHRSNFRFGDEEPFSVNEIERLQKLANIHNKTKS